MADLKISQLTGATTPLAGTEVLPVVQSSTTKKVAVSDLTAGRDVSTKNITAGTTSVANTQVSVVASASNDANEPEFNLSSTVFANLNKPRVKSANGTLALLVESGSTSTFQKRARLRLDGGGAAQATVQTSTDNGSTYVDRVTVDGATGDTTLNTGNLIQGTAAKGVNFTANTPAAGMTSQLLNWYEEGTWTPTGNNVIFSSATGKYTRVGRQVTVVFDVTMPSTSDTNQCQIKSLPFTVDSVGAGVAIGYTTNTNAVTFNAGSSGTSLNGYLLGGTSLSNATYSGARIIGSCTYSV